MIMNTYIDSYVKTLKLNNQSGTVCSLECYYKIAQEDKPKRAKGTGNFPVGQSKSLDLSSLDTLNELVNKGHEVWVTAFANVKAGKDCSANVWVKYKSSADATAEYTISGVINFTKISFNEVK